MGKQVSLAGAFCASVFLSLSSILSTCPSAYASVGDAVAHTNHHLNSEVNSNTNSKKQAAVSPAVEIPVLYMTDREISDEGFLNRRKHEKDSIYDVYCGTYEYIVDNAQSKSLTEKQERLGWHYFNKKPKYPLTHVTLENPASSEDAYKEFHNAIVDAAKKAGTNEIFIYLHGFNNPFVGAARSAARLAYYTECPVVLYSWPSAGRIIQYYTDVDNNEWSQEHFNRLLEELLKVKEETGIKFNLFAHSMGIKLAVRSAPVIRDKHLFEQVFFVNPDFDAGTFVHYISRFAAENRKNNIASKVQPEDVGKVPTEVPAAYCNRLRILFSSRDNALPIVQFLFGGYTRLGQGADTLLESLFDKATLPPNKADDSPELEKFHHQHHNDESEDEDIASLEHTGNRRTFEWIDYACLDYGFLGHSIPFQLVSNLWSTDKPGDGLQLVHSESGSFNRFTRFASWCFGLHGHIGSVGSCQKVVMLNSTKK